MRETPALAVAVLRIGITIIVAVACTDITAGRQTALQPTAIRITLPNTAYCKEVVGFAVTRAREVAVLATNA